MLAIILPSHVSDDVVRVTWPERNVNVVSHTGDNAVESCWLW
jgi:hypothetical protein